MGAGKVGERLRFDKGSSVLVNRKSCPKEGKGKGRTGQHTVERMKTGESPRGKGVEPGNPLIKKGCFWGPGQWDARSGGEGGGLVVGERPCGCTPPEEGISRKEKGGPKG